MITISEFQKKKISKQKISMVTCYDYAFARILSNTNIDALLVGDSAAQVMHGHSTTLNASTQMLALHTQAVSKGAPNKFLVADMPFLSTRKGLKTSMDSIERLMKAGAQLVNGLGCQAQMPHDGHSGIYDMPD